MAEEGWADFTNHRSEYGMTLAIPVRMNEVFSTPKVAFGPSAKQEPRYTKREHRDKPGVLIFV